MGPELDGCSVNASMTRWASASFKPRQLLSSEDPPDAAEAESTWGDSFAERGPGTAAATGRIALRDFTSDAPRARERPPLADRFSTGFGGRAPLPALVPPRSGRDDDAASARGAATGACRAADADDGCDTNSGCRNEAGERCGGAESCMFARDAISKREGSSSEY
jgi:hypothetical protein